MVEIEIDGKKVEVAEGSMVMHAAQQLGLYVPHFCYHKKLSIAANCRMCLVEVEKAPKPLPACATPVTQGMKVHTASPRAVQAQKGVMEFLLINHPLDCPICDQGGECQLQDLAVGYGGGGSRYDEPKRVVFHKSMGPLISAEEMSRCIHCTRCVRFGQEIAGVMELGMLGRGEHSEITSFVGKAVESELSGNMIDVCPVGALTSKPFRYSARTWELQRRKSVSPHDSIGANLVVQIKAGEVKRVVPYENEAINECWISDRDRFAYEGLNSSARLTKPMVRNAQGQLVETDWQTALTTAAAGLQGVAAEHGGESVGVLASPLATFEELVLTAKLAAGLETPNVDFRARLADADFDTVREGTPWLGMPIEEVAGLDRALVIGSYLRKDHPLLALRVRQAVLRGGAKVALLNATDDNLLMPVAAKAIVAPKQWAQTLAEVGVAIAQAKGLDVPSGWAGVNVGAAAKAIADVLMSGHNKAVLLGNAVAHQAHVAAIWSAAQWIADATGAKLGWTVEGGNGVGGYLAGAVPGKGGLNAAGMIAKPRKGYLLVNVEPQLDSADSAAATKALADADIVVALTPFADGPVAAVAKVLLPIGPFTETAGSAINCEGTLQTFHGAAKALGESRPGWKVLRVLGNEMGLAGFEQTSAEDVRNSRLAEVGDLKAGLSNHTRAVLAVPAVQPGLQRVADVPIFNSDMIVRRAESLQQTSSAQQPKAWVHGSVLSRMGLKAGQKVQVVQGDQRLTLEAARDDGLPTDVVRVAASHAGTVGLGAMYGGIRIEAA